MIEGRARVTGSSSTSVDERSTLVLINPIGNDADCWQFLDLKEGRSFEYPGHGKRPRLPGWTQESFAEELVAAFPGPLDLIGMSMGGAIVGHVLARHPERVRSAVISCSGSVVQGVASADAREARRRKLLARGQRALDGGMEAVAEETLARWFTPFALRVGHPGVQYARRTLLGMDPEAWNDIWLGNANSEIVPVERLATLETPVTIVAGLHDQSASLNGLAELHNLVRNSRFEVIAGPHMMHLEEPQAFAAVLDRHFAWAPVGNRVEEPIASAAWIGTVS